MARALVLAAAMAIGCAGMRAHPDDRLARVDAFVRAEMTRQKIPGVAIAVIEHGRPLVVKGYGYANVEHRVPVTAETLLESGSIGKQLTATAVMLLVEDGKLELDAPIARYFPEAPPAFGAITVRHLLTHTSGIPEYETTRTDYRHELTEDDIVKLAFSFELEFAPGSRWSYTNTGYALLGVLIHRVTGRFYGDVLHDRVFVPAGMTTTRVISEADIIPHRAAGYRLVDDELKNQEWVAPSLSTTADGALLWSITDLVAWDRALRAGAILKPESWKQVYTPVALTSGKRYPYGFGWELEPIRGHAVHRHNGSWSGFVADLLRYPDDELTVIALCNLSSGNPERFTDGIVTAIAPELAKPPRAAITDQDPEVTARLARILKVMAAGEFPADEFAHLRRGMIDDMRADYPALLAKLGPLSRLILVARSELADDRRFDYDVTYASATVHVAIAIAPDGKITDLDISSD